MSTVESSQIDNFTLAKAFFCSFSFECLLTNFGKRKSMILMTKKKEEDSERKKRWSDSVPTVTYPFKTRDFMCSCVATISYDCHFDVSTKQQNHERTLKMSTYAVVCNRSQLCLCLGF